MGNKIQSLIKKLRPFGYRVSANEKKLVDPVCGMAASSDISLVRDGATYYFCSDHCRGQFEAAPARHQEHDQHGCC